ncbi:FAD-binding protein [Brucella intermedia]
MIYDCLVIGGGTAGSAAAFTLAKAGLHVLVVDRPPSRSLYRIGESLPGQAIHLLKRKGLFEWVQHSHPLENPGDLSAWGSRELVSSDFLFSSYGNGWHIDRVAFDKCLQQAAQAAGATFSPATSGASTERTQNCGPFNLPRRRLVLDG